MSPSLSPVQYSSPQITVTQKLTGRVLDEFVGLPLCEATPRSRTARQMPMEFRVRLFGSEPVLIVMRSHPAVAEKIAERFHSDQAAPTTAEEALAEWLNRYSTHFINDYLPSDSILPFEPESSHPGLWPTRPSDVCVAAEVLDQPVEVRFWLGAWNSHVAV